MGAGISGSSKNQYNHVLWKIRFLNTKKGKILIQSPGSRDKVY